MVFSSIPFLFVFLPVTLLGYFLIPSRYLGLRNSFLLLMNLIFYAYGEPVYVLLMLASVAVNYASGLLLQRSRTRRGRKALLAAAVVRLDPDAPWAAVFGTRGDGQVLHGGGPADPYLAMDGRAVFRFAVETVPACIRAVLDKAGLTLDAVDWLVCHQANSRILHSIAKKLEQDPARFYENMQRYGNTSAASIPIALDEMRRDGRLRPGETVICAGFGAGLTWGGALLRV